MKDKARKLIRNVLLSAVASLYNTNVQAANDNGFPSLENLNGDDKRDAVNALRNKVYKNVLQITSKGDLKLIAGHRSHMSHRSGGGGGGGHYSHASHYSSYGGGGSSHSSHSSHSSSSYSTTYSKPKPVKKNYTNYNIGDRTIKSGLYGNDVSKLTALLVQKNYLSSSWVTTQKGYSVYNARVMDAVKRFQKDAGLTQNGVVTTALVEKLENWDASNTTYILGIRTLQYNADSKTVGNDVGELIALLNKAGYPPNPQKLEYVGSKAVFTADVAIAVKLFQAYNGLTANGVVDEATITKLKAVAK